VGRPGVTLWIARAQAHLDSTPRNIVLGERGEKDDQGVASTTSRVGAARVVAEVQERTAAASDTSSPPKEINAERDLRRGWRYLQRAVKAALDQNLYTLGVQQ
jgi:hypothetical protein